METNMKTKIVEDITFVKDYSKKVDWFGIICAVIAGISVAYFVVRLAIN
jgi:hypothetical protein